MKPFLVLGGNESQRNICGIANFMGTETIVTLQDFNMSRDLQHGPPSPFEARIELRLNIVSKRFKDVLPDKMKEVIDALSETIRRTDIELDRAVSGDSLLDDNLFAALRAMEKYSVKSLTP